MQAQEQQADRYQDDPWQPVIENYCNGRNSVSVEEILSDVLFIERAKWTQGDQNRVARCLTHMRWIRYRSPRPARQWRYRSWSQ
jgi:hypothetical protein